MSDAYAELDAFLDNLDDGPSELGTLDDLIVNAMIGDQSAKDFMRERWVARTIAGLRKMRHDAGLTQADVAKRLDTKQPAVARLEASSDLTLTRLWDYAYACGETPLEVEYSEVARVRVALTANPRLELTRANLLQTMHPVRYWWGGATNSMAAPVSLHLQSSYDGRLIAEKLIGTTRSKSAASYEARTTAEVGAYTVHRETTLSETLAGTANSPRLNEREKVV